ncbi:VRR-NUC domain-containing protein [Clostridium tetani]|uniref:VRR-NUC domain-containing protein n=1 Tax=Clostridium tetani TaxID=1513 RepID=UPI000512AB6A|nr:VRR-NUC domain-containing protein [Clostridium tetani]KGI42494.1 nuclease [Clostridium tetani]RXM58091.1 VRR-NUC domain-containing protein [Clostridium tetani]
MEESRIEKRLKKEIEKLDGKALKFVSPGMSGVPDRIILLPQGRIVFIELKAPGKKPRSIQKYRIKELKNLGFRVEIIDSIEGVNNFIREIK